MLSYLYVKPFATLGEVNLKKLQVKSPALKNPGGYLLKVRLFKCTTRTSKIKTFDFVESKKMKKKKKKKLVNHHLCNLNLISKYPPHITLCSFTQLQILLQQIYW
jgi:hypothetical protein